MRVASAIGVAVFLPAYLQHVAIRVIERGGGRVQTSEVGPTWLREVVGAKNMRPFGKVLLVDAFNTPFSDRSALCLSALRDVRYFELGATEITEAALNQIRSPKNVELLHVFHTHAAPTFVAMVGSGATRSAVAPTLSAAEARFSRSRGRRTI